MLSSFLGVLPILIPSLCGALFIGLKFLLWVYTLEQHYKTKPRPSCRPWVKICASEFSSRCCAHTQSMLYSLHAPVVFCCWHMTLCTPSQPWLESASLQKSLHWARDTIQLRTTSTWNHSLAAMLCSSKVFISLMFHFERISLFCHWLVYNLAPPFWIENVAGCL
jgi:hypothetical protein